MTLLSRKEAIATRWLLKAEDLEPIIGPLGAAAWEQHVQQMNPYEIAREYDYTVEAGKRTEEEQVRSYRADESSRSDSWPSATGVNPSRHCGAI